MHAVSQIQHHAQDLVTIFDQCFLHSYNTRLVGNSEEPIYRPADQHSAVHRVMFTRDYFASALHEVAHWCIAGDRRRTLVDYGYWYSPDGRTASQQNDFERAEVKPQALEWIFSNACGKNFFVSADNLGEGLGPSVLFKTNIVRQAQLYCSQELGERAQRFISALISFYGDADPLNSYHYSLEKLS